VAVAAKSLALGACKDNVTAWLAVAASCAAYYFTLSWLLPILLLAGGLITLYARRNEDVAVQV
jgi:hypothetical protein